jgi:hypothetical protein
MAAFREHVAFSSLLGVGYGALLFRAAHVEWTHAALAAGLCGVSGMLPDLDSDSGRPVREMFGLTAVAVPLLLLQRLRNTGMTQEATILLAALIYFLIRFGVAFLFKHLTVHRGMFHSLPAALIAAELVYLVQDDPQAMGRLVLAGGVLLGFLSHLVLDEIYAVDIRGLRVKLNKMAGSALKLFSPSIPATLFTWLTLGVLTYLICVDGGYVRPVRLSIPRQGASLAP